MNEDQDVPRSSAHALPSVGETRPPKRLKFLIANLELEFHVSPIRISDLRFSNRKKIAVCVISFRGLNAPLARTLRALTPPAAFLIIAGFFQRVGAPVGGLCTKLSRTGSGKP
jgi:hypothetical protein